MLSNVGTICFAASYAVAFALELTRLWFRSRARGLAMVGFAAAGLVAHTAFLYYRAVNAVGSPLSSEQDWYFVAAWAMAATYLGLTLLHPKIPFGLFLLPLALALIGTATFFARSTPQAREPALKIWGTIHGTSILLAAVAVLIGFMAGAMYLVQGRRLKHKRPVDGSLRLPSLEWLERVNSRSLMVSLAMLGVGIAAGSILDRITLCDDARRLPWHDPVVLGTWLMFFWLLAAVAFNAAYRPARRGRKVAYLTVAGLVFLIIMLAAGLMMDSRHWGRSDAGGRGGTWKTWRHATPFSTAADAERFLPAATGTPIQGARPPLSAGGPPC